MNVSRILLYGLFGILLLAIGCKPEPPADDPRNVVTVRTVVEPDALNPLLTTSGYSRYVHEHIFLPLLKIDPQSLEEVPGLAKGKPTFRDITEGPYAGGVAYTYELFSEANWGDGQPVTINDVLFTFKTIFNPKVPLDAFRSYFEMVKDVQPDPKNKYKFTILTNNKYFLSEASLSSLEIYPAHIYDSLGYMADIPLTDLTDPAKAQALSDNDTRLTQFSESFTSAPYLRSADKVVGAGPYRLVDWKAGESITLERKKDWWGDEVDVPSLVAYPQQLIFKVIGDPTAAINALKSQEIDVMNAIPAPDFVDMKNNPVITDHYDLYAPDALQGFYIAINTKRDRLSDKRVRRALAHLLDIDAVITSLYNGLAERITVPFHPSQPYYDSSLKPLGFNIEEARRLLTEAGWQDTNGNGTVDKMINGQRVELAIQYLATAESKFSQNLAVLFQENAKRVGVDIQIESKAYQNIKEDWSSRNFDMYSSAMGFYPSETDPAQLWHTKSDTPSGGNRVGFGTAESDALIDKIGITLDSKERYKLYSQLQQMIYDEQPMIMLFAPKERVAIHKRFKAKTTVMNPGYNPERFQIQPEEESEEKPEN